MTTASRAVVSDECVEALLQRVDANLPIKTGEPSALARRNLVQTQDCFVGLCQTKSANYYVYLINGLAKILRQLIIEHSHQVGHAPIVEENYHQSVCYLLETIWKCIVNSPTAWLEQSEKTTAQTLLGDCAKMMCLFSEKPSMACERGLIGRIVCQLSRRSFISVLEFVQKLFVEPERETNDETASPVPSANEASSSFALIQYFDLDLQQLNKLLCDFSKIIGPNPRKSLSLLHLIHAAPSLSFLLWRTVEFRPEDFTALHASPEKDGFFDPCSRIFDSCSSVLSSERGSNFPRQRGVMEKERLRQQLWPLMTACIVLSPKLTAQMHTNGDCGLFIEALRLKLKQKNDYEFVAPILARFCLSLGRLPSKYRHEELTKALTTISTELRQFLLFMGQKQSKNISQHLEDHCIQTLCVCITLAMSEKRFFKVDDIVKDLFPPSTLDPLQGCAGPTLLAIGLKTVWACFDESSSEDSTASCHLVLSKAAGPKIAAFFTQLTTQYLSMQLSSSSHSGSGGSAGGHASTIRGRTIKATSRAERPSFEDNQSPICQSIIYFLEVFISAPKLIVLSAMATPGMLNELIQSICSLLNKPMFKKCVRAIEQLCESVPLPRTSSDGYRLSDSLGRIRLLNIPIDAFSKRLAQNCSVHMLADFASALCLLSSLLIETLTSMRPDHLMSLYSTAGIDQTQLKETIQRFEHGLICRLWTTDTSTVVIILDCIANLCSIVEHFCHGEDSSAVMEVCPNLHSYDEMSNETRRQSVLLGRAALLKHVLTSLRSLRYPSKSVVDAWQCVFAIWKQRTMSVSTILKNALGMNVSGNLSSGNAGFQPLTFSGESIGSPLHSPTIQFGSSEAAISPGMSRGVTNNAQRRASSISVGSPSHDPSCDPLISPDDLLLEWTHLTYYLAALADAYYKHGSGHLRKSTPAAQSTHLTVTTSLSADTAICKSSEDSLNAYVSELLRMLVLTSEERYGARVEQCVRESLSGDLRPPIQSIVIEEAHKLVTKCFDITNTASVSDQNTLFVGNITLLFKMMLDKHSCLPSRMDNHISNTLEEVISLLGQYVRVVGTPQLHLYFCALLLAVLRRREEMGYRLETKFRAKVVDYLLNFPLQSPASTELVLLQLKVMSTVLARFPLIVDVYGGNIDHSHRLKLLKACAEFVVDKSIFLYKTAPQSSAEVDEFALQALLHLLLFNGDHGLSASLYLVMAPDARIRSSYLDALSRFIRHGITNNSASSEETSGDDFAALAELVTMLDDRGELPVVMALVEVVRTDQHHDFARLLTHLFEGKHLLPQLVISILVRELSMSQIESALRGSNLASRLLSYCFQTFGAYYVSETIGPIAKRLMANFDHVGAYEVNIAKLQYGEGNIEEHRQNLKKLTREVLGALLANRQRFPAKLRCLFRCVHGVLKEHLSQHISQSDVLRMTSGTLVFLRFINPFLTSLFEFGLIDTPCDALQRPFTLVAKLLQSAANGQPLREEFMKPFADFVKELQDDIDEFVDYLINSDEGSAPSPAASSLYLSEFVRHSLHYFLYTNQERVADCLRERRLIGRKPLERLQTLLNKLGPVELSVYLSSYSTPPTSGHNSSFGSQSLVGGDRIEPHLAEQMEKLREANIFYHFGTSANGNPVFYIVPKNTRPLLSDFGDWYANAPGSEALATLVTTLLKPYNEKATKWELIVDLTQAPVGVLFKSDLMQKFAEMPDSVLANLTTVYIYQCSPVLADYARLHDRFFITLRSTIGCRFIFPQTLADLRRYVPQLKLPQSTLALDEDVRTFSQATKMFRHKSMPMTIQVSKNAVKISTAEPVRLFAGCQLFIVEAFTPEDVEDVQVDVQKQVITLNLRTEPEPVSISHPRVEDIYQSLQTFREKVLAVQQTSSRCGSANDPSRTYHSRSFLTSRMTGTMPVRLRDISAFLLATGFANLSSGVASVQCSSLNLVASLCHRFDLHIDDDARLSNLLKIAASSNNSAAVKADKFFPVVWSSELVNRLSFNVCRSAPWLLLDFVVACSYYLAAESQLSCVKAALCDCIGPWLENLNTLRPADVVIQLAPSPINDTVASLVSAFIDLPGNAYMTGAVFPKLSPFFEVVFDAVLTQQTAIASNEQQKLNNALLVLIKTASENKTEASRVLVKYTEELVSTLPFKMTASNHRLVFFVRILNAFLAEDILEVDKTAEIFIHFSLALVGSSAAVSGESVYSLLLNSMRSFSASYNDTHVHRSLNNLAEGKYSDLFAADYQFATTTPSLAGDAWFSLIECVVDLVAAADKNVCERWANLCRRIISAALDFAADSSTTLSSSSNSSTKHQPVDVMTSSVREAVRILGILCALPPNSLTMPNVVGDIEKTMKILSLMLKHPKSSLSPPNVSVGISSALYFFARVTPNIPTNTLIILGDLFWLAFIFLMSDEQIIYANGLILLDSVIISLRSRTSCPMDNILTCFQAHAAVFKKAFSEILPGATAHGLKLPAHVHFVLARLLFKSIDHSDNAICAYASRLLLRLHQPSTAPSSSSTPFQPQHHQTVFAFPPASNEAASSRSVVYSLVAHIIMPDYASRVSRRQGRSGSFTSSAAAVSVASPGGIYSNSGSSFRSWEDRLMDMEKLETQEKVLYCEFLFALLLASPKNQLPQRPTLLSLSRLFAAAATTDSVHSVLSAITCLPEIKAHMAELLRTTHDPETLTAAQSVLEYIATIATIGSCKNKSAAESTTASSLFASLHRIPITFITPTTASTTPMLTRAPSLSSLSAVLPISSCYASIADVITDGCLIDCVLPKN